MMRWFRLLNVARTVCLERENAALLAKVDAGTVEIAALLKQREGDKRGIKSLVDSIGRQAPAGSETELRGHVVLLDGRVKALEVAAGLAVQYLRTGRPEAAKDVLAAILDTVPAEHREAS